MFTKAHHDFAATLANDAERDFAYGVIARVAVGDYAENGVMVWANGCGILRYRADEIIDAGLDAGMWGATHTKAAGKVVPALKAA